MDGELIGINGRGSFEKRGRVNSGVGYAISINQIKNFLAQLKAGMDTDHASLGALMESDSEEGALAKVVVKRIIPSDALRRGLDIDDQLVSFAGRPVFTVNQFKNVLGLYPKGWRVPIVYRHENDKKKRETREVLVRLMGVQRQEIGGQPGPQPGRPGPRQPSNRPPIKSPATKLYEAKAGFANYYFNKQEQQRLLAAFHKHGDFGKAAGRLGHPHHRHAVRWRRPARQARRRRLQHSRQGSARTARTISSRPSWMGSISAWNRSMTTRNRSRAAIRPTAADCSWPCISIDSS